MLVALTLSLLLPATSPAALASAARSDDPPIRIKLSDDAFARGDRARVRVKTAQDGYLVVLRADAEGRVRVLFPLDPGDNSAVRGGREIQVRGRGDREAFTVDEREGSGMVLAARSVVPFRFDEFVRGGHWDYRALSALRAGDDSTQVVGGDAEAALLDIVERMAGDNRYDYDVVTYTVSARAPVRRHAGWYGPWYGPWYDPFYYPFYGPGFGFRTTIAFGRSRFGGHRHW